MGGDFELCAQLTVMKNEWAHGRTSGRVGVSAIKQANAASQMWRKIWRQSKVSAARLMRATANKLHSAAVHPTKGQQEAEAEAEAQAEAAKGER